MSSKLFGSEDESGLQPLVWRRVGEATVAEGPPKAPLPENAATALYEAPQLRARIAELEQQIPLAAQKAHQAGFREGEAAAAERAQREIAAIQARFAQSVEQLVAERRAIRKQQEEDLVHLSVAIARRVLHRELSVDPEALAGIVRAVLDRLNSREVQRLRVHPLDAPALETHLDAWQTPVRLQIERDSSLERGALVFDTERGFVDSSIETQLREIDRGFTDLVRRLNR